MTKEQKSKFVICDTNIISSYVRPDDKYKEIKETVNKIGIENVVITPVIYIELMRWLSIYKGISKVERTKYKVFFENLNVIHLNKEISKIAVEISSKDNSMEAPDILIGATAVYNKIPLYTKNIKHFKRISKIKLYT